MKFPQGVAFGPTGISISKGLGDAYTDRGSRQNTRGVTPDDASKVSISNRGHDKSEATRPQPRGNAQGYYARRQASIQPVETPQTQPSTPTQTAPTSAASTPTETTAPTPTGSNVNLTDIKSLATKYVQLFEEKSGISLSTEERTAKIEEVASFYSAPSRDGRLASLIKEFV